MNFLIRDVNLEADDVSVLDFGLDEGVLRLHELDHTRFDLLGKDNKLARYVGRKVLFFTS